MGGCELNALEEPIPLFTYFTVDPLQTLDSYRSEVGATLVRKTVEYVMPEPGLFEELRLPVETIFRKSTCKVIENVGRCFFNVFKKRRERVLSALSTLDQMQAIRMTMERAKPQKHIPIPPPLDTSGKDLLQGSSMMSSMFLAASLPLMLYPPCFLT